MTTATHEQTQRKPGDAVRPSSALGRGRLLQRKCTCGGTPGPSGECEECHKKRVQRKVAQPSTLNAQHSEVPPIVHEVLRSPGQPLDAATRAFMEPRFGYDFSRVRLHADAKAAESAQAVNARAFTVGQNVVFATGEFAPHTPLGRQVLAHELTHTIQQAPPLEAPLRSTNLKISESSDASEQQADRIARTINTPLRGQPIVGEYSEVIPLEAARLQRLGANPGCTAAEKATVHQAIFNARGWLNKAIPKVEATPLSAEALATIRRNFGPTYGASENAGLIAGRLRAAYHGLSNNPYGCGGAEVALCAAGFGASTVPGSHASTVCRNVTLVAGRSPIYQAGVVLHESFHAAFSGFTAAVDSYSGWHGASGSTPGYPGVGKGPLLNADTYTTLVIELS